MIFKFLSSISP